LKKRDNLGVSLPPSPTLHPSPTRFLEEEKVPKKLVFLRKKIKSKTKQKLKENKMDLEKRDNLSVPVPPFTPYL
jgi:hypothetical protein